MRQCWAIVPFLFAGLLCASAAEDAARLLGSAKASLQQRKWQAAVSEFEKAIEVSPRNIDAHIGLGIALWGAGDRPAALAAFRRATELNPSSAQAHYNVALALRDSGETARAIAELKTALKLNPAYNEARLAMGVMLQQQGDVAGAMAEYRLVLKRDPGSAEAHNWLGVAYMQKNLLAEAEAELRTAIKLKPNFARAHNNLGSTLAQAGDLERGIASFREGLKHAPQDLQLHLNLGTALRNSGETESAIREFEVVLRQDPGNPEIHHQLGLALREKGDLEGAIREFETAIGLDAEYRDGYYALGQTLRQAAARRKPAAQPPSLAAQDELKRGASAFVSGDLAGAVNWFRKAVASDPQSADAFNDLGLALARSGDLAGAVENLSRATSLRPEFPEAHLNLAAALWKLGEKARAAASLDEVLRLNPASVEACNLRALAYRDARDDASARRLYQRAIAIQPALPYGYFDLGVVFMRLNDLKHALGQFEAGLNLPTPAGAPSPDLEAPIRELRAAISGKADAEAHNVLGRMLGRAGADTRLVLAEFEEAIRIQPEFAEARNNLGLVYLQTGQDENAIAAFREAIRLRPEYADAHANLGATLTATDVEQSIQELEKAIALQPGLLRAHYNLAIAYGSSPKHGPEREAGQLKKLLAMDSTYRRGDFALGKALLRRGNVGEAITHLERAAKAEPEFGEAQYQLGLALSRAGRAEEAAQRLQRGRELIALSQKEQLVSLDLSEGKAALEKGEFDQAAAKFRQVLRALPDLAEAHYQLGLTLKKKGDTAGAAGSFRTALERDPKRKEIQDELDRLGVSNRTGTIDDPATVARLEAYFTDRRFIEVQPLLEEYLKGRPNSSWGWYALGYSLFAQQKLGESIKALSRSLSLNVANASAHKVLGRTLMMIGRFEAAQLEFEQGEKYDPKSAEIPFNLGRLFSIQDQYLPAKAAFERSLRIEPQYMEAHDGLGFALEALGEDAGAIAAYLRAIQLNEERAAGFATPYINLSAYYNRKGATTEALDYARKAVGVNARADRGYFQMARAQERLGELDAAAGSLNSAIAINPRVASYYYVLSTVYRRQGKMNESQEAMEKFSKLNRESNELEERRRESLRPERAGRE